LERSLFHMGIKVIKWGAFQVCDDLCFLTFGASFDIGFNELVKSRSFISAIDEIPGVRNSRVASSWGIVNYLEDLSSCFRVIFEVDLARK
jgi:hypothetical protein